MKMRTLYGSATVALAMIASAAPAATIELIDKGGVAGSPAERTYRIAAAYWGSVLSNDITIRLGAQFSPIEGAALGNGGPTTMAYSVADWKNGLLATRSNSTLDQTVVLPTLTNGAAAFINHGAYANGLGIDTTTQIYDNDTLGSAAANNSFLSASTALVRAIGGQASYADDNTLREDGAIFFNSNYTNYDFDLTNGLDFGKIDFLNVVLHEMGHALGFISGLEYANAYGGPGGDTGVGNVYNWQEFGVFTPLDMFRYSQNVDGVAPGGPSLDMTLRTPSYFSVDGGNSALYNGLFSTGSLLGGDGYSPSHWKSTSNCFIGVMNPTVCDNSTVTALDLATFDAMGYNINVDVLTDSRYARTTQQIAMQFSAAVPEPATWAMIVSGFGVIGGALRGRRRTRAVA